MRNIDMYKRPSPTAILNPRSAPAFKGIFTQGTKESDLALKTFLSAMLGRGSSMQNFEFDKDVNSALPCYTMKNERGQMAQ